MKQQILIILEPASTHTAARCLLSSQSADFLRRLDILLHYPPTGEKRNELSQQLVYTNRHEIALVQFASKHGSESAVESVVLSVFRDFCVFCEWNVRAQAVQSHSSEATRGRESVFVYLSHSRCLGRENYCSVCERCKAGYSVVGHLCY